MWSKLCQKLLKHFLLSIVFRPKQISRSPVHPNLPACIDLPTINVCRNERFHLIEKQIKKHTAYTHTYIYKKNILDASCIQFGSHLLQFMRVCLWLWLALLLLLPFPSVNISATVHWG